jgi:hypothetical protein
MNHRPSLPRIVQVDYLAYLAVSSPVIFWIVFILIALLRPDGPRDLALIGAVVVTVGGMIVLLWRALTIRAVFGNGMEVPATVKNVAFARDRARIDFTYTHQGKPHTAQNNVRKASRTGSLKSGDRVTVVVDRNNLTRAFIRDFYL